MKEWGMRQGSRVEGSVYLVREGNPGPYTDSKRYLNRTKYYCVCPGGLLPSRVGELIPSS